MIIEKVIAVLKKRRPFRVKNKSPLHYIPLAAGTTHRDASRADFDWEQSRHL